MSSYGTTSRWKEEEDEHIRTHEHGQKWKSYLRYGSASRYRKPKVVEKIQALVRSACLDRKSERQGSKCRDGLRTGHFETAATIHDVFG